MALFRAALLLFGLFAAWAQTIDEPTLRARNGTLFITASDVVFVLNKSSSGSATLSTSVTTMQRTADTMRSSLVTLASSVAESSAGNAALASALANLSSLSLPALSGAVAAVAASTAAVAASMANIQGASNTSALLADLSSTRAEISTARARLNTLDADLQQLGQARVSAEASLGALISSLQNASARANESLARSIRDALDVSSQGDLELSTQIGQLSSRLTQTNASLSQDLRSLASASAGADSSLQQSIQSTFSHAQHIGTTLSVSIQSVGEAAATRSNLMSTSVQSLAASQSSAWSDIASLSTLASSTSATLQATIHTTATLSTTIEAQRQQLSAAVNTVSQSAVLQVSQVNITLREALAAQAAAQALSVAFQAARVDALNAAQMAMSSSLSTAIVSTQTFAGQVSTSVGSQIAAASTATGNLALTVYPKSVVDNLISTAAATLSSATATQVSTLTFAVAARLLSSDFVSTLSFPFNVNSRAPTPTNGVVLGISGCVLWLDAMNYYSVNANNPALWGDISRIPSMATRDNPTPRYFGFISQNSGRAQLIRGAYHFNGNGYFTNSACNTANFLPTGTSDRTLLFWARSEPSNAYLRHVFHYGSNQPNQAFGAAFYTNAPNLAATGLALHTWGSSPGQGIWSNGEVAFMAITLSSSGTATMYSKNGAPRLSFATIPAANTASITGDGFCNVGARVSPDEYFNGAISAIYMFNRVLSDAEINTIYTNTLRVF